MTGAVGTATTTVATTEIGATTTAASAFVHAALGDARSVLNISAGTGSYEPSARAQEDARLLRLSRASFTASQGIYGAPRIFLDLREAGETCRKHRVARLMRTYHLLRALHG